MKRASPLPKETKEKILKAANVSNAAARFIVSDYYRAQELRKRADMQIRHLGEQAAQELSVHIEHFGDANAKIEDMIKKELQAYAEGHAVGRWMLSLYGVGPVISAGCLAHLDIKQAPTAGHFWRFCGLDPTKRSWGKGEKRPFCADMRQICFHFGECTKRTSGKEESLYGQIYKTRKALLVERNERGDFAERAKVYTTTSADVKKTLQQGKLPAGNLDHQACNFAAKMFLSHLHALMFWDHYGKPPPKPFAMAILGHAHEIRVPNSDMFPGFDEAYYGNKAAEAAE
jgi:hypothetical protein